MIATAAEHFRRHGWARWNYIREEKRHMKVRRKINTPPTYSNLYIKKNPPHHNLIIIIYNNNYQ